MTHDAIINLDYASHTPVDPRVLLAFSHTAQEFAGNVMAAHSAGRKAREEMERATAGIAGLLDVKPEEIIFTSGASEANNLAIKGILSAYSHVGRHVLSTCLEHPSVSGTLAALDCEIELLKILPNGTIDLAHLKNALRRDTVLVCVSVVDSELGVIQPIADIAEILAEFPQCHLHVDAAQAVGKIPFKLGQTQTGAIPSTISISPHKFHGICGVGILVKRQGVVLQPQIHGGTSTTIYRSGTPALSLAVSAYTALELAIAEMDERFAKVTAMRDYIISKLTGDAVIGVPPVEGLRSAYDLSYNSCASHLHINTPLQNSSPYILNISVSGIKGTDFQAGLDSHGVCVSVKSACSTDRAPSRAVFAITRDKKRAASSWRVSFSHLTTMDEIDRFISAFTEVCRATELRPI